MLHIADQSSAASRWHAVSQRDPAANGTFVYAVKTTGIYCRPTCGSRLALRKHVEFFTTPQDAEHAGYRACKRCRANDVVTENPHTKAIAAACALITTADSAPESEALAAKVGMSLSHFHRVFKSLTGLTPKAYAIAQRSQRVRNVLSRGDSITTAIYKSGFNSNGRFYASSTKSLGMKPATFRASGEGATIRFAVSKCTLGSLIVGATELGICFIALGDEPGPLIHDLRQRFSKAKFVESDHAFEKLVSKVVAFVEQPSAGLQLPLDIRGTAFQHRVWQKLSEIPCGQTQSYSQIARKLGKPKAIRAVAQACAANSLAVVIPCHRVVRTDGKLAGYRWGIKRKAALLERERRSGR